MILVASAIVVLTIGLWAARWLPEYLTGLLFFTLATVSGVAPPGTIFSGFASSPFWLVLSGFVLGEAMRKTGVPAQISTRLRKTGDFC
jgi:di/tricarboxylate transporter